MCDKSIRLYSKSKSMIPHQSSFADRQNGCSSFVPDFLTFVYYFHDKSCSPKVCSLFKLLHYFKIQSNFSSAGFSVVCDEVCNDWTEYQDAGGVIQVCHVSCQFICNDRMIFTQTRSKGCTQKRTDPSKNIGGSGKS